MWTFVGIASIIHVDKLSRRKRVSYKGSKPSSGRMMATHIYEMITCCFALFLEIILGGL